ncbi:hypothetical protein [Nocardia suismassiliense]|uniref:hypothetical protein n=1 Tax=Nocardia suismassiliense TaxID=2077092 RepID=UPI000D1D5ADA|nr:hypothetical protein [Nocardia suismassiliense]
MRIIRNNDDNDKDPEDFEPNDPKDQGEKLADEVADFLAAVAERAPFPTGQDAPAPAGQSVKPELRLVKTDDVPDARDEAIVATAGGLRPRLVRAGAGGSAVVIVVAVFAAWGEPPAVAVPITVYGAGWMAYLWWNAALRPPIPQAIAFVTTATSRATAALFRAFFRGLRRAYERVDAARTRHETTRTATT